MRKIIVSILMISIFSFQNIVTMVGVNPDQQLLQAAEQDNLIQMQIALNQGANIDFTGGAMQDTALIRAIDNNNYAIAEYLLERGADPNRADTGRWTPLHIAVSRLLPTIVKLLLDKGADPTLRNNVGQTPTELLHFLSPDQQKQPNVQQIRKYFEQMVRPMPDLVTRKIDTHIQIHEGK